MQLIPNRTLLVIFSERTTYLFFQVFVAAVDNVDVFTEHINSGAVVNYRLFLCVCVCNCRSTREVP